jgi:predicted membrane protein
MKLIGKVIRWFFLVNVLLVGVAKLVQRQLPDSRDPDAPEADVTSMFEESRFASQASDLRRVGIITAYGQSTVDLSATTLSATGAEVNVFTVFGETELIVPSDWNVISDHGAIAGALERRGADLPENPKGTIHLGGVTLFGATIIIRADSVE